MNAFFVTSSAPLPSSGSIELTCFASSLKGRAPDLIVSASPFHTDCFFEVVPVDRYYCISIRDISCTTELHELSSKMAIRSMSRCHLRMTFSVFIEFQHHYHALCRRALRRIGLYTGTSSTFLPVGRGLPSSSTLSSSTLECEQCILPFFKGLVRVETAREPMESDNDSAYVHIGSDVSVGMPSLSSLFRLLSLLYRDHPG